MSNERTRHLLPAILVMFLICGVASPVAAADSSMDKLCVGFSGDIGYGQYLYLNGVRIIDCDGHPYAKAFGLDFIWHNEDDHIATIDLPGKWINCNEPFKEVKLYLTLIRSWGFFWCYNRVDLFTLDVTDLVTKTEGKPNTVKLKAYNSYKVGQADAVTIYDCNKNELKYFSPTHKEGYHGIFDIRT